MEARASVEVEAGRGLVGDHAHARCATRHVSMFFRDGWEAATGEVGVGVDPVGRRANVLLSGPPRLDLVGRRIRLGTVVVAVQGELTPCVVMDGNAPGLCAALVPAGRGGVWGTILAGGVIRPGDEALVLDD